MFSMMLIKPFTNTRVHATHQRQPLANGLEVADIAGVFCQLQSLECSNGAAVQHV